MSVPDRLKVIAVQMTTDDAQCLYDHLGTFPFAPNSWSGRIRGELSVLLSDGRKKIYVPGPCPTCGFRL